MPNTRKRSSRGPYPNGAAVRDRWILARRGPRKPLDPERPYAWLSEEEPDEKGRVVSIATIFLTNRECPWRCLMCDLWSNTLADAVPDGAISRQIRYALDRLAPARWAKLYNAGSFFDPRAIPPREHPLIAEQLGGFRRVIVECHPALVGKDCLEFRDRLPGRLEVAMGLETIHPEVLPRLNKRMTVDQFRRAAALLREWDIAMRAFVLVGLPFLAEQESLDWARRSIEFAFDCGAETVSLLLTRMGNGALEALRDRGEFAAPRLASLEAATAFGVGLARGRVFADLWDLERFRDCPECFVARRRRLHEMNLRQEELPSIPCLACASSP